MQISKKMFRIFEYFTDSFLPIIFWVALFFGFDTPGIAILSMISAIIHESGHILATFLIDGRHTRAEGHLSGLRIRERSITSYKHGIIITATGPCVNIAVFLITFIAGASGSEYLLTFALINLATGLSNLLPIEGYDGFNILKDVFSYKQMDGALNFLYKASFILTVCLTFLSLYLVGQYSVGYWFFAVFFISVITKIKKML